MLVFGPIAEIVGFDRDVLVVLRTLNYALVEIGVEYFGENCEDVEGHSFVGAPSVAKATPPPEGENFDSPPIGRGVYVKIFGNEL